MLENLEMQFIKVGDINLHVVMAGPQDGEPVVLLHGFPEFWYAWKNQIPYLAEQGYRVIVPDQRGYNLSDKPKGVGKYTVNILAQDIINLVDVLGYDKFSLGGHDWGGIVSWRVATLFPERLKKLIILNIPHPTILVGELVKGNFSQWRKSSYIAFFQLPFLPEAFAASKDYFRLESVLHNSANLDTFSDDDIDFYRQSWSQPNALTSMINWYRAIIRGAVKLGEKRAIVTPTLLLWGEKDTFLGKELAQPSIDLCDEGELIFYPNATHWIQHEEIESINHEIVRFLRQSSAKVDV